VLAWPVILGHVGMMAMGVVDVIMVGQLGGRELAITALGHTWSFAAVIVGIGMTLGLDPVVSQAWGAQDHRTVGLATGRGVVVAVLVSVPLVIHHLLATQGLALLAQPDDLLEPSARFSEALAWSVVPLLVFTALRQTLQGLGIMKPATWVVLGCNVLNAVANWVWMYGNLGAPAMGAQGCAWATTLSRWVMLLCLALLALPVLRPYWVSWRESFGLAGILQLLGLGLPLGLQLGLEVWSFNAALVMMGWMGENQVAAHTVAINLASISFMVPLGLGAAAATVVGNRFGAGEAWWGAARSALILGVGFMCVSSLTFFLFPGPLARLYTDDPRVLELAVTLIPLAATFQLFDGAQVVSFGVLRGLGDVRLPVVLNALAFWGVGLPVGYHLSFARQMGAPGVWWGLAAGLSTVACLLLIRIRWMRAPGRARRVLGA
jgi:MATE family multidrug resistance protein